MRLYANQIARRIIQNSDNGVELGDGAQTLHDWIFDAATDEAIRRL